MRRRLVRGEVAAGSAGRSSSVNRYAITSRISSGVSGTAWYFAVGEGARPNAGISARCLDFLFPERMPK